MAASVALVVRYLCTGDGLIRPLNISVIVKTVALTPSWCDGRDLGEGGLRAVSLRADSFWEDFVSFFVIALHTIYLGAVWAAQWPLRIVDVHRP
jgi:3-vinyl bacteriochlorophyllide hydratase